MAVGQRPIAEAALNEAAGAGLEVDALVVRLWRSRQEHSAGRDGLYGRARACTKKTVVVKGASHVVMTSQPEAVTRVIVEAASR